MEKNDFLSIADDFNFSVMQMWRAYHLGINSTIDELKSELTLLLNEAWKKYNDESFNERQFSRKKNGFLVKWTKSNDGDSVNAAMAFDGDIQDLLKALKLSVENVGQEPISYPGEKFTVYKGNGDYKEFENIDALVEYAIKHRNKLGLSVSFSVINTKDNFILSENATNEEIENGLRKAFDYLIKDLSSHNNILPPYEIVFFNKKDEIVYEFGYTNELIQE